MTFPPFFEITIYWRERILEVRILRSLSVGMDHFYFLSVGASFSAPGGKRQGSALGGSVSSYGKARGLLDPFIRCMAAAMHDNPVCFNGPSPQTRTLTNQLDRIFFQKFLGGKHTLFLMYTKINVIKKCYILRQNLFVLMVHCCVKYCLCVAMSRIAEFSWSGKSSIWTDCSKNTNRKYKKRKNLIIFFRHFWFLLQSCFTLCKAARSCRPVWLFAPTYMCPIILCTMLH